MSEDQQADSVPANLSAASASLRDTSKWIVGGVVGTAAGIFAGSSLTNLGSLTLPDDWLRILIALGGAIGGLLAIGSLAWRALAVLTVKSLTFEQVAQAVAGGPNTIVGKVATDLQARYKGMMPGGLQTFAEVLAKMDAENAKSSGRDEAFVATAASFLPGAMAEATFMRVYEEFEALKRALPFRSVVALIGFGAFAWAANPPEGGPPASAPKPAVFVFPIHRPSS